MRKILILLLVVLFVPPAYADTRQKALSLLTQGTNGTIKRVNQAVLERALKNTFIRKVPITTPIKITNLPKEPLVRFSFPRKFRTTYPNTVRLIPRASVFNRLFFEGPYRLLEEKKLFVPKGMFIAPRESLYRGLRLENFDELKNLLVNGLELDKCLIPRREIYTTFTPSRALLYAVPRGRIEENLPVLIKIPFVSPLQKLISWREYNVVVFNQDIPAEAVSDIWVFLDVNGKPDWCKATLQDGDLVLIPGYGEVRNEEDLNVW